MLSWVIKRSLLFADEIVTVSFIIFVTVATGTGESQISQSRRSAVNNGHNVFHSKRIRGNIEWTEAIFTASVSTPFDGLPETLCNSVSQWEEPANRVVS